MSSDAAPMLMSSLDLKPFFELLFGELDAEEAVADAAQGLTLTRHLR